VKAQGNLPDPNHRVDRIDSEFSVELLLFAGAPNTAARSAGRPRLRRRPSRRGCASAGPAGGQHVASRLLCLATQAERGRAPPQPPPPKLDLGFRGEEEQWWWGRDEMKRLGNGTGEEKGKMVFSHLTP